MSGADDRNEGEGSRTAARVYNEKTKEFVEREDWEKLAGEAAVAVEGREKEELLQAEKEGKSKLREEDPQVKRDR